MDWTGARNVIVKLDRAAHLSNVYCQTNRMHANAAQTKSCRAYGKNGHMSASCNIPKTKLNCSHWNLKGSHTTSACLKKKKANKKKDGSKENKKEKVDPEKDPPSNREPSNETRRTNSTSFKRNLPSSQENFHNVCVQLRLKEEMDSEDTDSTRIQPRGQQRENDNNWRCWSHRY